MTAKRTLRTLLTIGAMAFAGVATAGPDGTVKTNFSHTIPNIPGKSLVAVEVSYPPGGATPAHTHARSAFIYAYVVSGRIVSEVAGEPQRTYGAGESFYETPGAHHLISRNASQTEPAKLLAVFVVDTNASPLTVIDKK